MRNFRALLPMAALPALVGACAVTPAAVPVRPVVLQQEPKSPADAWQGIANTEDVTRIKGLRGAWEAALAEARASNRREVAAEGDLLKGNAALARPAPTPGSYQCRMVRLGKTEAKARAFERFQPFFCYVEVEGDLLTIVKQTGSQRPAGRLWEDDDPQRLIFLGSLALGAEDQPKAYGEDPQRDMAGVVERIGPFRWRLVIPWPRGTAKLDVFELTPVAEQPKAS